MRASAVHVIAVGKAAGPMLTEFVQSANVRVQTAIGIGPAQPGMLPSETAWFEAGHPVPDQRSVAAARGALQVAHDTADDGLLIVLLSGGASALMALPAEGLTLADKQETVRRLLNYQTPNSAFLSEWFYIVNELEAGVSEDRILAKYPGLVTRNTIRMIRRILNNQLY